MRLLSTLVAGTVVGVSLAACTPAEAPTTPTPEPTPTLTTQPPSPSPSPTTESPSPSPSPSAFQSYPADLPTQDPVSAAIIEGWQEYQRVYEKFAMAPNDYTDYSETQLVTWGHESTVILDRIDALRDNHLAVIGGRQFHDLVIGEIGYNNEGLRAVMLTYCLDVNELQVRDTTTGELVERSGRFIENAYLAEGPDQIWRVEGLNTLEESC